MKTIQENRNVFGIKFSKSLKYTALAGILLGLSYVWFALNRLYIHWPGSAEIVSVLTGAFIAACFWMVLANFREFALMITWVGMAYTAVTLMFMAFRWPGGNSMGCYGVISLITICAAIWYLCKKEVKNLHPRKAIAIWVIVIQLVFIILWYVKMYYLNYVVDQFEPAIPYAEDSVYYQQIRIWTLKYITMGNGIAMLLSSIYLYVKTLKRE